MLITEVIKIDPKMKTFNTMIDAVTSNGVYDFYNRVSDLTSGYTMSIRESKYSYLVSDLLDDLSLLKIKADRSFNVKGSDLLDVIKALEDYLRS